MPMQQLFVLNSDFMVRQAKALVGRLNAEKLTEEGSRIELAYRILFQRSPTRTRNAWASASSPHHFPTEWPAAK